LDVTNPKPDPESVILILSRLNVAAEKTLYVGDAVTDALAAKGAGVAFVAYRNPSLEAAHHIIGLDEVKRIVDEG
jgi:phosphoglycolate phosphatase-like HAD superfamily hydrolase